MNKRISYQKINDLFDLSDQITEVGEAIKDCFPLKFLEDSQLADLDDSIDHEVHAFKALITTIQASHLAYITAC